MFACRNCVRVYLRAVLADSISAPVIPTTASSLNQYPIRSRPDRRQAHTASPAQISLEEVEEQDARNIIPSKKELQRELLFLADPYKLAERTLQLLRQNDEAKAVELVKLASNRQKCTVSWNHIISYKASKGELEKAFNIFNTVSYSLR
jgi:hypothetical protein